MKESSFQGPPLHVVAIVQARMGASRLPGKPLKEILGKPLLFYLVERLKLAKQLNQIVIATTDQPQDQLIVDCAKRLGVDVVVGDQDNVLSRFGLAAEKTDADVIVRITADCPLIDPTILDQMVREFLLKKSTLDYLSNTIVRTFPRGLDVEIFSRKALNQALKEAKTPSELEHVTPYFYHHPNLFRRGDFVDAQDESHYRLTVDTEEDFKLMKWIIEALYPRKKAFSYRDILDVLKEHPEWEKLNEHVKQKHL